MVCSHIISPFSLLVHPNILKNYNKNYSVPNFSKMKKKYYIRAFFTKRTIWITTTSFTIRFSFWIKTAMPTFYSTTEWHALVITKKWLKIAKVHTVLGRLFVIFTLTLRFYEKSNLAILEDLNFDFWEKIPHLKSEQKVQNVYFETFLFRVKSNLTILGGQKLQFLSFLRPWILIF